MCVCVCVYICVEEDIGRGVIGRENGYYFSLTNFRSLFPQTSSLALMELLSREKVGLLVFVVVFFLYSFPPPFPTHLLTNTNSGEMFALASMSEGHKQRRKRRPTHY